MCREVFILYLKNIQYFFSTDIATVKVYLGI